MPVGPSYARPFASSAMYLVFLLSSSLSLCFFTRFSFHRFLLPLKGQLSLLDPPEISFDDGGEKIVKYKRTVHVTMHTNTLAHTRQRQGERQLDPVIGKLIEQRVTISLRYLICWFSCDTLSLLLSLFFSSPPTR